MKHYFDDLNIVHTQSTIVAGADYYPFGLVMDGREITDEAYRYGYQGQYSEENETTGWNEFELRMYDARFGRWLSVDPYGQYASPYVGMGNNPTSGVDPNGGKVFDTFANAAGVAKWFETAAEAAANGFTKLLAKDLAEVVVTATRLTVIDIATSTLPGLANLAYDGAKVAEFSVNNNKKFLRGDRDNNLKEIRPVDRNPTEGKSRYDCSGYVSYCLGKFYPTLDQELNLGPANNISDYGKSHGGIRADKPKLGDIALWDGHAEFVIKVHPDGQGFTTNGSSGKYGSAQPTTKVFNSPKDPRLKLWGRGAPTNGKFLGFWTPVVPMGGGL